MAQNVLDPYAGTGPAARNGSNSTWATNPNLINAGANTTPYRTSPTSPTSPLGAYPHASLPTWGGSLYKDAGKEYYDYMSKYAGNQGAGAGGNGYGYGGGSGGGGAVNAAVSPVQSIWDALMAQRQAAISAANAALDEQAALARARYKSSKKEINHNYQDLRNQHSVGYYKAKRSLRESLADRGALNSGPGMQENLKLSSNLNNGMNKINTQEQSALETLRNNLNQYLAQIDMQKAANMASGMDNYMNLVSQLGNFAGYTAGDEYNALAQSIAAGNAAQTATPVAQQGVAAGLTTDDLYNTLLRQWGSR